MYLIRNKVSYAVTIVYPWIDRVCSGPRRNHIKYAQVQL